MSKKEDDAFNKAEEHVEEEIEVVREHINEEEEHIRSRKKTIRVAIYSAGILVLAVILAFGGNSLYSKLVQTDTDTAGESTEELGQPENDGGAANVEPEKTAENTEPLPEDKKEEPVEKPEVPAEEPQVSEYYSIFDIINNPDEFRETFRNTVGFRYEHEPVKVTGRLRNEVDKGVYNDYVVDNNGMTLQMVRLEHEYKEIIYREYFNYNTTTSKEYVVEGYVRVKLNEVVLNPIKILEK